MAIHANVFIVLSQQKKEAEKPAEPVIEKRAEEPKPEPKVEVVQDQPSKGLFAHKPSQFLHDMLKEQN